jgi:hypothetical protein
MIHWKGSGRKRWLLNGDVTLVWGQSLSPFVSVYLNVTACVVQIYETDRQTDRHGAQRNNND